MGLDLNAGQKQAAILLIIAFVLTVIMGIILSFLAVDWETSALVLLSFVVFLFLSPLYAFGIYRFARASQEEAHSEEMTLGRALLDRLRQNNQQTIESLALNLATSPQDLKAAIEDLSRLELFNGLVNWESGEIRLLEAAVIASLETCQVCKTAIRIQKGLTICQTCRTEYHQY